LLTVLRLSGTSGELRQVEFQDLLVNP
jgi:hypothetical protein